MEIRRPAHTWISRHSGARAAIIGSLMVVRAVAQQPAPNGTATLTVTTQIVTLDATVNDHAGHPVNDLRREDFEVRENNALQSIRYFSPPTEHRMPNSEMLVHSYADIARIGDAPVALLVLDEINSPFADMALARSAMQRYLQSQPAILSEPTALLFVNNTRLDMIADYTQDRDALSTALKRHFPDYPWQLSNNAGDMAMLPRMSATLSALVQIAEATKGIQGRKNVVWVGAGFPSVDITEAPPDALHTITEAVRKSTFALLQSKVTLFTIDPATIDTTPILDRENDSAMAAGDLNSSGLVFHGNLQFNAMAAATGGHAFAMNNFIDQEIATSLRDGVNYYEISYRPTAESDAPAGYRRISITVRRPGLTVITRDGYFPMSTTEPGTSIPRDAGAPSAPLQQLKFDLSTAAMNHLTYNGLTVNAIKQSEGWYQLSVNFSGIQWRDAPSRHVAELSILAVCFTAKDKPVCRSASEHTASTEADTTHLSGAIRYNLAITVPAGATRIRFVVRDISSGRLGSADLPAR